MSSDAEPLHGRPLAGYFYTDWLWDENDVDHVKSLLLFFDKMVMTLPTHLVDATIAREPVLAQPLYERGILVNIQPERWLDDRSMRERVTSPLRQALKRDLFVPGPIHERMTGITSTHFVRDNSVFTRALMQDLRKKGLIGEESADTVIEMNQSVRVFVLAQLATAFLERAESVDLDLNLVQFTTPSSQHHQPTRYPFPSRRYAARPHSPKSVLTSTLFENAWADFRAVGVDLSRVPLDEVLDFREQHGLEYRAYMRKLRSFTNDLRNPQNGPASYENRAAREEELRDESSRLRRLGRAAFAKAAGVIVLSGGGVAWGVAQSDALAAVMSALSSLLSLPTFSIPRLTPYAYLFALEREFRER